MKLGVTDKSPIIKSIDTANAEYDILTFASAIAGLAEGDILSEATEYASTGGGAEKTDPIPAEPKYTPNMVVGAVKEFTGKGIPTIDAAYEAVVLYPSLNFPLLEDWLINPGKVCLKANPNILFIKQ